MKNILGKEYGITSARGKWIERKGIWYMPTWHPAALLRDETKKIEFWRDLKLVMEKYKSLLKPSRVLGNVQDIHKKGGFISIMRYSTMLKRELFVYLVNLGCGVRGVDLGMFLKIQ